MISETKADLKEGPDNNSRPWIMFSSNWLLFGEGGLFEIGHPRSRGERILDVVGQVGWGGLDNFHGRHMRFIP